MKVLLINKFQYQRGGSEMYHFALAEALVARGHKVIFFAMRDQNNIPCEQEKYFVSNVDFSNNGGILQNLKEGIKIFYSFEAKRNMEQLIRDEKPDIAHIGLIHRQLTFSIIDALKRNHIPIVMTMHDLIFACPNYTMLRQGKPCEACLNGYLSNCIRSRCVKGSFSKSLLGVAEAKFLQKKSYYNKIDLYIAECKYYQELMKRSQFTSSTIIHMTNFLPLHQEYGYRGECQDYVLYFGRFAPEKGIMTLLRAHKSSGCKYRLILVGAGPIEDEMKAYIQENHLTNIEMPGAIYGENMERMIEAARVVIIPSEWYENCPYAMLQSLAKGKIVIASRIGGLPELIEEEKTGFLFEPGNAEELAGLIERVHRMPAEDYDRMSRRIADAAYANHNWSSYIDRLVLEYEKLI